MYWMPRSTARTASPVATSTGPTAAAGAHGLSANLCTRASGRCVGLEPEEKGASGMFRPEGLGLGTLPPLRFRVCAQWLPSSAPPQVQSVRDDSSVATCVTFVGGADIVAVGSHSGEIRMIDAVAGEVRGSARGDLASLSQSRSSGCVLRHRKDADTLAPDTLMAHLP